MGNTTTKENFQAATQPSGNSPIMCPRGTYGLTRGLRTATCSGACVAGYYCPVGTISYITCPAGFYCPAGSSSPIICPIGSYCPEGSSSSTLCPGGTYGRETSLSTSLCTKSCPVGFYCPPGTINPLSCPVGLGGARYICRGGNTDFDGNNPPSYT
jgi:hypothetical protein